MSDDRNPSHDAVQGESQLRVDDLTPPALDPKAADAVKGGADSGKVHVSDIPVTKSTDPATPKLF
jgi:type VI protein secretion system component Hcp